MPSRSMQWLLGHQGGWDEVGLFALPVVVALGAVWFVERRQKRRHGADDDTDPTPSEEPPDP